VWAVVKANAYGHGIERAFAGLRGADGFALLDLAEAERLRALDWRGPILLLEGVFEPRDLELCSRLNLWHAVHCEQQIDWLARHKTHAPHRVFLKMNSGMNRLGFTPAAFRQAWARLNALPQVDEISLMTHFSDADVSSAASPTRCRPSRPPRTTCRASARWQQRGHAALGPTLRNPASDWVRAGILLLRQRADHPAHTAPTGSCAGDDPALAPHRHPAAAARRHRGLRQPLHRRARDAHRRGGLRLCRRLPALCAHRHAGAGGRRAHPPSAGCRWTCSRST
jgi:alanine racemase